MPKKYLEFVLKDDTKKKNVHKLLYKKANNKIIKIYKSKYAIFQK